MTFWDFANNLRKENQLCDVNFHVLDQQGQQKTLQAHKVIVAYYSLYLCDLISGNSVTDINISEVTEEILLEVLQLIYQQTSLEDLNSSENFQEVIQALKTLQVDIRDERVGMSVFSCVESRNIQDDKLDSTISDATMATGYQLHPFDQNVYNSEVEFIEKLPVNKDVTLSESSLNFTLPNSQDVEQVITNLGSADTCDELLTEPCVMSVPASSFAGSLTDQSLELRGIHLETKTTNDTQLSNAQNQDCHNTVYVSEKSSTHSCQPKENEECINQSKVIGEDLGQSDQSNNDVKSAKQLKEQERSASPFKESDEDAVDQSKQSEKEYQSLSPEVPGGIIKTAALEESTFLSHKEDKKGFDSVKFDAEAGVACHDIKTESGSKSEISENRAEVLISDKGNLVNEFSVVSGIQGKKRRKNFKKDISMDVLRRFCAKQAERKKQAATGQKGKVPGEGTANHVEMKGQSKNNNFNVNIKLEKSPKRSDLLACQECGVILPSYSVWERHVLKHTGEKPFACEICGKKYSRKGNLVVHQKSHGHRDRKYLCRNCSARFMTKGALKSHHQNMHTAVALSKCEHCDSVFKSAYSLKTHIDTKHEIKQVLSCEECDKTFTNPIYLKRHKLTHTDELPFHCKHCSLAFRTYGARATHLSLAHTKEMFICDICGNSYHSKPVLLAHSKRVHLDKDPSRECPICHKYVSNFYNHIRMHKSYEKGEVFSCPECGKTFPLKTYLQQHMYVHRKKRFSCSSCKKEFTFNASLQSHLKNCIHRKARASTSMLPFQLTTSVLSNKQNMPQVLHMSDLCYKNIQSTIQQPFVFKYQAGNCANLLPKDTPALEAVNITHGENTSKDVGEMEETEASITQIGAVRDSTAVYTTFQTLVGMEGHSLETSTAADSSVVLQDQLVSAKEPSQGARSIRIQPADSGKSVVIEQTSGQEFSEDQLASIVSSLGIETFKGDVRYVCILPE